MLHAMKYDVFISYSRKDSATVEHICHAFDRAGIRYFIDRQGIAGGFEFPKVLAEAIMASRIVLFVASRNSYESKYTNAELTFAFNEKAKNTILPYIIDGSTMPMELRLVFSGLNWRTLESHPIEPTLVADVRRMLNCGVSAHSDTMRQYGVGDYYDENGKQGVVFEVSDDGRHGKIVSLDECRTQWCTLEQYDSEVAVGTEHRSDGSSNTNMVMSRSDRSLYPAFLWCCAKGEGWYLPAIDEVKAIAACCKHLERSLAEHGEALKEWLWSSTEYDGERRYEWDTPGYRALLVEVTSAKVFVIDKHCNYHVRAIARF